MDIDTTVSVPLFNVVKHFLIAILMESVVRQTLSSAQEFFRAKELRQGLPVSLSGPRIDRYNLQGNVYKLSFTTILTLIAYTFELSLEFSSSARTVLSPVSATLPVVHSTHGICNLLQLSQEDSIQRISQIASSCITKSGNKYSMFRLTWQKKPSPSTICIHTSCNVLQTGELPYESFVYPSGSAAWVSVRNFQHSLAAHSWGSNGDIYKAVIIIHVFHSDVKSIERYNRDNSTFVSASLITQVNNSDIKCVGSISGTHGEGSMFVQYFACFRPIRFGQNFIELGGTATVRIDASDLGFTRWNVLIASEPGMVVFNFTKDVFNHDEMEKVGAYAFLLGGAPEKTLDSFNRYAAIYKHCDDFLVPKSEDKIQVETVEKAMTQEKINAFIPIWIVPLVVLWPLTLFGLSTVFRVHGRRMKIANKLQGEGSVGQRWIRRNHRVAMESFDQNFGMDDDKTTNISKLNIFFNYFFPPPIVFLNVVDGEEEDDISVGLEPLDTERNTTHPFKRLLY